MTGIYEREFNNWRVNDLRHTQNERPGHLPGPRAQFRFWIAPVPFVCIGIVHYTINRWRYGGYRRVIHRQQEVSVGSWRVIGYWFICPSLSNWLARYGWQFPRSLTVETYRRRLPFGPKPRLTIICHTVPDTSLLFPSSLLLSNYGVPRKQTLIRSDKYFLCSWNGAVRKYLAGCARLKVWTHFIRNFKISTLQKPKKSHNTCL